MQFIFIKHHCRHCCQIFCGDCLRKTVTSGPNKRQSRVCNVCYYLLVQDSAPFFSSEPQPSHWCINASISLFLLFAICRTCIPHSSFRHHSSADYFFLISTSTNLIITNYRKENRQVRICALNKFQGLDQATICCFCVLFSF